MTFGFKGLTAMLDSFVSADEGGFSGAQADSKRVK
jgi:hypothetical protein